MSDESDGFREAWSAVSNTVRSLTARHSCLIYELTVLMHLLNSCYFTSCWIYLDRFSQMETVWILSSLEKANTIRAHVSYLFGFLLNLPHLPRSLFAKPDMEPSKPRNAMRWHMDFILIICGKLKGTLTKWPVEKIIKIVDDWQDLKMRMLVVRWGFRGWQRWNGGKKLPCLAMVFYLVINGVDCFCG